MGSHSSTSIRFRLLRLAAAPLLAAIFLCAPVSGHAEPKREDAGSPPAHRHQHPAGEAERPGVGLEPRTGERIPLDLAFRDEKGRPVRLGDLIDGPTLILPVYYRCPNVCTFLQAGVAEVLGEVAHEPGRDYRVISVSFNERETEEDAAKARRTYLSIAGRDFPPEAWRFLTGDAGEIRALFDAAGYSFQRQGEDFLHPVLSFVVTADGMIARYLYGTRPLPKDLTLAIYEARSGRAGATIRKVVRYCFSYDRESQSYSLNLLRLSGTVILVCIGVFLAYLLLTDRKKKKDQSA